MSGWAKVDTKEFEQFAKRVHVEASGGFKNDVETSVRKAGDIILREVDARTPVDTGFLRGKWRLTGAGYEHRKFVIKIANSAEYASFVEDGHRQQPGRYVPELGKQLKAKWVPGQHMLQEGTDYAMPYAVNVMRKGVEEAAAKIFEGD
ncbi:HK97 gp10 family phage protein [Lacticaseibacillus hulanensis]|uniref:HK97 gp10 family phage protein n=1 Tax=Lacticaseibacillus hulanensis TaxID=2493111 RepID=UPI000FDA71F6|nr:HK97 gp10 family phage protein [Lacticaseibacillus hulanensis]